MKRISLLLITGLMMIAASLLLISGLAAQDDPFTGVFAEAIGTANLRDAIGVEGTTVVSEINAGTRYPVIGRSELYPWLLLGNPETAAPIGWVFADLVNTFGTMSNVPITEASLSQMNAAPVATASATATAPGQADVPATTPDADVTTAEVGPGTITLTPSPTPQATTPPPQFAVSGRTNGEINIRYWPDPNAQRLGVAQAGEIFEVTGYHTQFPWVQIAYPGSPNGSAWVARDLLEYTGDVLTTRAISTTIFNNLPTLTPTSAVLGSSSVIRDAPSVEVSAEFEALGNRLWSIVLNGGFDPMTSQFGALYLRDLQTGEEIMFGNDIAFSGTSINKVAIMAEYFGTIDFDPDMATAGTLANMMICSHNEATNSMIEAIADGDAWVGAQRITQFMRDLGLQRTFLTAPYAIPGETPSPPTVPVEYPQTSAQQDRANPNVTNQMTVDEMGYLMTSIYECAFNERGALLTNYPEGTYTPQECRKMLHLMANNNVDALLKAGVPEDITVSHKHGWIDDTHGNAAVVFTPGGDYVLVMMVFKPVWLQFEAESLPVIAEVSRTVYNYYNPDAPLEEIRDGFIPDSTTCNYRGSPVVQDLINPLYGLEAPAAHGDIGVIGKIDR